VSDGVNAELLKAMRRVLDEEGASLEIVAPKIGGVEANDGSWIEAHQTISGGPSVLYDAAALLVSEEASAELGNDPAVRDFVSDAFAHSKFIAYVASVLPLLKATLGDRGLDAGFVQIETAKDFGHEASTDDENFNGS
jgi:catalase